MTERGRTMINKYYSQDTRIAAGFLVLTISCSLAIAPALADSLSGGPKGGSSHSGGPTASKSGSLATTKSGSLSDTDSNSQAGQMKSGSTKAESVFKKGSSKTGMARPAPGPIKTKKKFFRQNHRKKVRPAHTPFQMSFK